MKPEKLISYAIRAQKRAHAKYSDFPVGAAILCKGDTIILGCNIESKAYPTTICAERVAIFSALTQGYSMFEALAVGSRDGAAPCGSCRQIIAEYAGDIPILIAKPNEDYIVTNTFKLLPQPFI